MTQRQKCIPRMLGALVLFQAALVTPTTAQATANLLERFGDVQNAMIQASIESQRGQIDESLATIDQALVTLDAIRDSLGDPAIADSLGKKVKALGRKISGAEKKVGKARAAIVDGKRSRIRLKKLRVASKAALKAAGTLGRPVVAEKNARSAGFHKPGEEVRFQIFAADGSACGEPPIIDVVNDSFGSSVDLSSLAVDEASGVITVRMGEDQGGGRIVVTACGRSATVLVYNYGPKPPKGLPRDFPTNLPPGNYTMTFSGSVNGTAIPTTTVGVFLMDDLKGFADEIANAFRLAATNVSIPGCNLRTGYSGFDGTGFGITIRIACKAGGVSVSANLLFRIDRV